MVGPVGDPRERGCLNDVLPRGGWSAPGGDRVQRWLWLLFQVCMVNVHAIRIDKTSIMSLISIAWVLHKKAWRPKEASGCQAIAKLHLGFTAKEVFAVETQSHDKVPPV